jgi:hypothetical protein
VISLLVGCNVMQQFLSPNQPPFEKLLQTTPLVGPIVMGPFDCNLDFHGLFATLQHAML